MVYQDENNEALSTVFRKNCNLIKSNVLNTNKKNYTEVQSF